MITLSKLTHELSILLEVEKFSNDPGLNGLQVQGRSNLTKIGLAVSANLYTIQKAIELNCDALLVHHGLFWKKSALPQGVIEIQHQRIKQLLTHDIALLAYHLPLDAHRQLGHNWKAAEKLQWKQLSSFADLGVQGHFDPIAIEQFIPQLETLYDHPACVALGGKKIVSSAALVSGAAYNYLPQAATRGVDCLITGSFEEPLWAWAHEYGIHFLALGHHATERIGMQALGEYLQHTYGLDSCFISEENLF